MESEKQPQKAPKKKAASDGLTPVASTLQAIIQGNVAARVDTKGLSGELKQVAGLLNDALANLTLQISDAEARKQNTAAIVDNALEGLIALVRQGELSRWNATTDDPLLGPLLDGFGKVIDTLRTFVREINEAALRLSSSANEVLAASTQHES